MTAPIDQAELRNKVLAALNKEDAKTQGVVDMELWALRCCVQAFSDVPDEAARRRMLGYLFARYGEATRPAGYLDAEQEP